MLIIVSQYRTVSSTRHSYYRNTQPTGFGKHKERNTICKGINYIFILCKVEADVPVKVFGFHRGSANQYFYSFVGNNTGINDLLRKTRGNRQRYIIDLVSCFLCVISEL